MVLMRMHLMRAPMRLTLLLWLAACIAFASTAHAREASFGLPPLNEPTATDAQRELGRKLFFDRRLSSNGTMSCGMCHVPEEGFTSNASQLALGLEGRSLKRNAPGLLNVAWQARLFHDGRQSTLDALAWEPLLHPHEMGNTSVAQVLAKLGRLDDYTRRFVAAYPRRGLQRSTVGEALAAYQRSLVAADSAFDRWRYGSTAKEVAAQDRIDDKPAASFDAQAQHGFALFTGKAGCSSCHTVGENSALFSDGRFHVTGAGMRFPATLHVPLAPGVTTQLPRAALDTFGLEAPPDQGRFHITHQPADRHAFKTPSLRNLSHTAPYMHDGSLPTLDAVLNFYDRPDAPNRSPLLQPLALTPVEKQALLAFLRSLDSPHVGPLIVGARRR